MLAHLSFYWDFRLQENYIFCKLDVKLEKLFALFFPFHNTLPFASHCRLLITIACFKGPGQDERGVTSDRDRNCLILIIINFFTGLQLFATLILVTFL